jgi:hypothetical protein
MLTMRDHDVHDYVTLRDMDATDVGVLSEDDRACLADLGRYLVDAGADQRFAVWLLHKHFEPEVGEVFVERALTEPRRRIETTPVERSVHPGLSLTATALRFDTATVSGVGMIGMEFAEPDDFGSTRPLRSTGTDEAVLAGLAERLRARGKIERFGVKLIRNPLDLRDRELLLETSDGDARALYCDVTDRAKLPDDVTIIETTWRYTLVQGATEAIVMQDCTAGCISVPGGHDIGHAHSQTDNDDDPIGPT